MLDNKRIAKNTMLLYIRMGISMLVGLYTSRVVLQSLGVDDYGIYNVVGSFIVAFTFISGPLGTATQRFLNFELGKGESGRLNRVFNLSLYIYIILSIVLFVIIEIAGIWFLNNKMQLPTERMNAATFAFHISVLTLQLNLVKTPFESLIIAYEKMSFYAYVSIADVLLKLLNAFMLIYVSFDKLKLFSVNIFVITLIVGYVTVFYCVRVFKKIRIENPYKNWDFPLFKELMSFSGWSFFSGAASMTANQGVNILLNTFFGVVVNASMGVATQVLVNVQQFVGNFQKAFNPQIVKLYAAGDLLNMQKLVIRASRFSYLMLFAIVCPFLFNVDFLLEVWLKNPPQNSGVFCVYLLIWSLLESLMAPLWISVNATGKIRNYHLVMNPIILSVILISFVALKMGFPAYSVVVVKCVVDVVLLFVRLLFAKNLINLSIIRFLFDALLPVLMTSFFSIIPLFIIHEFVADKNFIRLLLDIPIFFCVYAFLVFCFGLIGNEKKKIVRFVKEKISLCGRVLK